VIQNNEYKISDNNIEEDIIRSPNTNYEKCVCTSQNTKRLLRVTNSNNEFLKKNNMRNTLFETEEWVEIMRSVNMHPDEFEKFQRNKLLSKLIDAIEMLNRLLIDKNMQISVLEKENESLNEKNIELNNDNINLIAKNAELISSLNNLKLKFTNIESKKEKLLNNDHNKVNST
jgi:hypothetical protein